MLTKEEMPACPVATTVALIGSKWKLLILRNLLARPWRFNELKRDLAGISQKSNTRSVSSENPCGLSSDPWRNGARHTSKIIRRKCNWI